MAITADLTLTSSSGALAFRPPPHWNAGSLATRSASGAQFLQTQLCMNTAILREYMQRLVATRMTWKYSVMVSLAAATQQSGLRA